MAMKLNVCKECFPWPWADCEHSDRVNQAYSNLIIETEHRIEDLHTDKAGPMISSVFDISNQGEAELWTPWIQ